MGEAVDIQGKKIPGIYHKKTVACMSNYVSHELMSLTDEGHAYQTVDQLYSACQRKNRKLSFTEYCDDLSSQIYGGFIHREGKRLYMPFIWQLEESSAEKLSKILLDNSVKCKPLKTEPFLVDGKPLAGEQENAVNLVRANKLCAVVGGGGTGKTTVAKVISQCKDWPGFSVFCAPTGKACQNFRMKTGLPAMTLHSALGLGSNRDYSHKIAWSYVGLVVVDEASMMDLEMLEDLLGKVQPHCHVVLMGDVQQLPSVDTGNVLPDLIKMNIPHITLRENHRQSAECQGLCYNVFRFPEWTRMQDLMFDESFQMKELADNQLLDALVEDAVRLYKAGASVQVLSPYREKMDLCTERLNQILRDRINPYSEDKAEIRTNSGKVYREGDRVIITRNDWKRRCCNGDVGILRIHRSYLEPSTFEVELEDGRCPKWECESCFSSMDLAYALTVHKAQGSGATRS